MQRTQTHRNVSIPLLTHTDNSSYTHEWKIKENKEHPATKYPIIDCALSFLPPLFHISHKYEPGCLVPSHLAC